MRDSWRCNFCKYLMYNTTIKNGQVYPATGAPEPKYASTEYPCVCNVCFDILTSEISQYWAVVAAEEAKKKTSNKRLKPGSDYYQ